MAMPPAHPASTAGRRRRWAWIALVLGLCALIYFLRLGEISFLGKDEPKNAQAAREMLRNGDWVITTLDGEPWYDKPILYYWTAMVAYRVLGAGELAARIGPVLAALLAVWITYLLGCRALARGGGRELPLPAGALAAFILGTGQFFFYYARTAVTDSLLTASVTGALSAYFFAREGIRPGLNMHLAWASTGLAVLAKGPIGLLIPGMVIGADLLWSRRPGSLRRLWIPSGALVFLALVAPWYTLVTLRSHGAFVQEFLLYRNVARFATEQLPHPGPFWYYLPVLLLAPYPWSLFLPGALMRMARSWKGMPAAERGRLRFFLLWIFLPAVFFSFAGSKLPSYLLPVFPAVAVLLARELRFLATTQERSARSWRAAGLGLFAAFSLGTAAGGAWYVLQQEPGGLAVVTPLLAALGLSAIAALVVALFSLRRLLLPVVAGASLVVPIVLVLTIPQHVEGRVSAREISRRAMAFEPRPGQLLSYRFYDNGFFFYTNSRTERYDDLEWIEARLREVGGPGWCFVRSHDLPEVLGYPGLVAEDLGAVDQIHLVELRPAAAAVPSVPVRGSGVE